MEGTRPTVDQYFMDMTHLVKSRGTCPRRQVGALIVKDKRVLTTGYNGAPRNFPHPTDTGCIRDELRIPSGLMADVCPCLHAEQNALLQAATTGVSIEGADLYCTTQPCTQCSRMIANCGIGRVIFEHEYADPLSIGLLVTAGVELWKWDAGKREAHPYGNRNTWAEAQDELRKRWRSGDVAPSDRPLADSGEAVVPSDAPERAGAPTPEEALAWQRPEPARKDAPPAKEKLTSPGADRVREAVQEVRTNGAAGSEAGAHDVEAGPGGGGTGPGGGGAGADDTVRSGPASAGADAHQAREEARAEGVRDIAGDPEAREIVRRLLRERRERLERALDEPRS